MICLKNEGETMKRLVDRGIQDLARYGLSISAGVIAYWYIYELSTHD